MQLCRRTSNGLPDLLESTAELPDLASNAEAFSEQIQMLTQTARREAHL